jgi:hypothetical protein
MEDDDFMAQQNRTTASQCWSLVSGARATLFTPSGNRMGRLKQVRHDVIQLGGCAVPDELADLDRVLDRFPVGA